MRIWGLNVFDLDTASLQVKHASWEIKSERETESVCVCVCVSVCVCQRRATERAERTKVKTDLTFQFQDFWQFDAIFGARVPSHVTAS